VTFLPDGGKCEFHWAANVKYDEDVMSTGWDYTIAMERWSDLWDMTRPIFFEKTPSQWVRILTMVEGIRAAPLPPRMVAAGIRKLDIKAIMMWRPWCMSTGELSSHAEYNIEQCGQRGYLRVEHELNRRLAAKHRELTTRLGVRVLVVSYADLLWQTDSTLERMQDFLPEVGTLDMNYAPVDGVDVWPLNQWKAVGDSKEFGKSHPPSAFEYDTATNSCPVDDSHYEFLSQSEKTATLAAYEYLRRFSGMSGREAAGLS